MPQHKSFETARLILKPTQQDDAEFSFELMNSPKWIQNIGDRNINTVSDAKHYIKTKLQPQFDELGYGNYTLIRKSDGIKIGVVGLYNREGLDGIDLGFALLPDYEKMGFAFESSLKLLSVAFEVFKIEKLKAITLTCNETSQNLLVKLGFRFEKNFYLPDDSDELMLFSHELKRYLNSEG